jgi:alpha-L-fucosidase 2
MKVFLIHVLLLFIFSEINHAETGKPDLKLWYKQPANECMESTPVGSGRLGAMIFGGINNDRIALNGN